MGTLQLSKTLLSPPSTPFDFILEMIVDQNLGFIDPEKSKNIAFEDAPKYIQKRFSYHPWSMTQEQKEYLMSLEVISANQEAIKRFEKNREIKLRMKHRNFRNIGSIVLMKGEFPPVHQWNAYQEHRLSEFDKLEAVIGLIRKEFPKARLYNREAIPIHKNGDDAPSPYVLTREFSSPYINLQCFTKISESTHDLIDIKFS